VPLFGRRSVRCCRRRTCTSPLRSLALNETIFGDAWPGANVRLDMLEGAVDVIRRRCCVEAIKRYTDAGLDELYIHQIGPNQDEFFTFFVKEVEPLLG